MHTRRSHHKIIFIGDHVPQKFVEVWKRGGKRQVICQAELFPIWIAKVTWRAILSGRPILWFSDNEAARAGMVKSYPPLLDSMHIIRLCAFEDVAAQSVNWYARVPSKSNISDAASRLDFSCYQYLGFTSDASVFPRLFRSGVVGLGKTCAISKAMHSPLGKDGVYASVSCIVLHGSDVVF